MKNWQKVLFAMVLGLAFGFVWQGSMPLCAFVGKAFIDLLKMLVGFVVFFSLVTGACQFSDLGQIGKIGGRTLLFFATATLASIGIAFLVGYLIQPGSGLNLTVSAPPPEVATTPLALLSNLIPISPVAAFAKGEILQIVVFGFLIAYAILITGAKAKPVIHFFESFAEVLQNLTSSIMKLAPIGVFCLMATAINTLGVGIMIPMLGYVLCNWIGCLLLMVIFYPIVIVFVCRKSVFWFYREAREVILFAMSTCSSSASLPLSIECATKKLGVSPRIAQFVLSLGITLNMNGSVICQISAAIFVSQAYHIDLSFLQMVIIALTSILASIGVAGVPGSSMIMLSMVLASVGLPVEGVALVLGVDRLRDMVSTMCNITGDLLATVAVGGGAHAKVEKARVQHG